MALKSGERTIAAVTAAVAAYLDEEAEALLSAMPPPRPVSVSNLWGRSGREEIMRMRTLWQRRIIPRGSE
ncbi:MAG: hypothetical protein R6V59_08325 [Dehalococcoidia bacterium]